MASGKSNKITCNDGTVVPYEWIADGDETFEWMRDRSHWPDAMPPMEVAMWQAAWPGADRAWQEIDMVPPPMFHRMLLVGPYLYVRMTPPDDAMMAAVAPRYVTVGQQYGGALRFWEDYCLPRIEQSCADLDALDGSADLRAAAETWFYGLHQTFTSLVHLFIPNLGLTGLLTGHVAPEQLELTIFELTQGGENATQAIDEDIWSLAELARSTPAVSKILGGDSADALARLRAEPAASAFVAQFDDLIARHGRRSLGWSLTEPTWAEHPDAALALVRAQIAAERVSPDEWRQRTARLRQEATDRVLAMLPPEKHDQLRGLVQALDGYVSVREGRAYWQLVIVGAMRNFLLRVGERLVREGRIAAAADVFVLTPEEIASGPSDLRPRVAAARAEWEHLKAVEPPFVIGTPGEVTAEAERRGEELRGSPASRGTVTGTARILHSPDEGARLQQGDILVTVMTTPAWTPLFAIAGGIITETGGALSHPAITAREYGIPAVLALREATTRIKDGQKITIDGATGVVTVQG